MLIWKFSLKLQFQCIIAILCEYATSLQNCNFNIELKFQCKITILYEYSLFFKITNDSFRIKTFSVILQYFIILRFYRRFL